MASRPIRIFRAYYECFECTAVSSEWERECLTLGPDWCPNCGLEAEPYSSEALFQDCECDDE